ncbi:MAG: MliC family protein [Roseovarius sp.]
MPRLPLFASAALAFCTLGATGPSQAETSLSLPLPLGRDGSIQAMQYSCDDGTELSVQYVNAGSNNLALIPLKGETRIFVSVLSGSGARYVSGPSEWYSKDGEARLSDESSDAPAVTCASASE